MMPFPGVITKPFSVLLVILIAILKLPILQAQAIDFDKQIAPILVSRCLECHQGVEPEAGLSLTNSALALRGGEHGPSLVPGKAAQSLLWKRVENDEMPPDAPLEDSEKELLQNWIEQGASWNNRSIDLYSITTDSRAGRDWWALQPLSNPTPPKADAKSWVRNPIDAFILEELQKNNLEPASEADPRALVRRLYFDLIGLPPTPQQINNFVSDSSEKAYQQLVTDLLDSKHYGERWGRHWLDVVRFGESDGFERNFQRDHAWHYRDWVIRALNEDMPYDQFVTMQLIGDQLSDKVEGAAATGFWVAGVHNTTVGGSRRMKLLARQDEIEEVLATVGQTFVGLTINCARCHDHKFDPITQKEYYQLASAISGLGYGNRVLTLAAEQKKLESINQEISVLQTELVSIDEEARRQVINARKSGKLDIPTPPVPIARWEFDGDLRDSVGTLHGKAVGNARIENGTLVLDGKSFVETPALKQAISAKTLEAWVQLDNLDQRGGAAISLETLDGNVFDAIVFGEREPKRWMAGSNVFARTESFAGTEETQAVDRPIHVAMVYQADGTIICFRDGKPYGKPIRKAALQAFVPGEMEILFGLRHKPGAGNRFLKATIHRAALYDRALSGQEVAASNGNALEYVTEQQIVQSLNRPQQERRVKLKSLIEQKSAERDRQAEQAKVTIYTLNAGSGATTNLLLRGDPEKAGEIVTPASTSAIAELSGDFDLPADAPEAERRRKLAEWITDKDNPLFARVMANRMWHYHFGSGIVDTPSDFGFNGGRPSHPRLLEFLAWQFREHGFRLKRLHRLIVSSSTYRQTSAELPTTAQTRGNRIDSENRLLWRGNPRRLEAEVIRDAMIQVAGEMDDTIGGPSFRDVSVNLINGTTYYEPLDVLDPTTLRRTVYRFNPRGGRSALLDTFDCPDSAATTPRRTVTTTPLQSLSLMNNSFVIQMAEAFAKNVAAQAGENPADQIQLAWQRSIGREPTEQETHLSMRLAEQHGLPALCRGLFNLNEFVVID